MQQYPRTVPGTMQTGGGGGMQSGGQPSYKPGMGGYLGQSSGPGDRRYYDEQRNNLMAGYDQRSGGLTKAYEDRYKNIMGMAKGIGTQQVKDAQQQGRNMQSEVLGNMAARGLSGTTVLPSMGMAAQRNTNDNVNRIQDQNARLQTGLAQGLSGDTLGYRRGMESERMGYGAANLRDSRGDFESDRGFGEGQFQTDRAFGRNSYEDDRNFNRGVYMDDRNFSNRNFESDRDFQQRRGESDRDYAMRVQAMQSQDQWRNTDRNDRLALERLDFMERRNDTYPNLDSMYSMFGNLGQYY